MNDGMDAFDAVLGAAVKGFSRNLDAGEEFTERLLRETRPFARFRDNPCRWAACALVLLAAFGACAAWIGGAVVVPLFASAGRAAPTAAPVLAANSGEVRVPVRELPSERRVREPRVDDAIDASVENALKFIAGQQQKDGSFPGAYGASTAIPSLVGMAFLSKGYLPGSERYGSVIRACIDYVLSKADLRDNAPFRGYMGDAGGGRMYAHAISTLFLSECSGMVDAVRQAKIDETLPLAVKVILDAQNQKKGNAAHVGGWRYAPNAGDSDLSCSGWALMALKSARLNGAQVPPEAIEKAVLFIKRTHVERVGAFAYQPGGGQSVESLTGAAILCLELCGRHLDADSLRAAKYLMDTFRRTLGGGHSQGFYALYYTAQGLFQIGGEHWKAFCPWMYETYLKRQQADGSWRGGGDMGSPVYATAMTVLAFTVPYRMLPIYQRDETVDE